jgi:hypothetical protein
VTGQPALCRSLLLRGEAGSAPFESPGAEGGAPFRGNLTTRTPDSVVVTVSGRGASSGQLTGGALAHFVLMIVIGHSLVVAISQLSPVGAGLSLPSVARCQRVTLPALPP